MPIICSRQCAWQYLSHWCTLKSKDHIIATCSVYFATVILRINLLSNSIRQISYVKWQKWVKFSGLLPKSSQSPIIKNYPSLHKGIFKTKWRPAAILEKKYNSEYWGKRLKALCDTSFEGDLVLKIPIVLLYLPFCIILTIYSKCLPCTCSYSRSAQRPMPPHLLHLHHISQSSATDQRPLSINTYCNC